MQGVAASETCRLKFPTRLTRRYLETEAAGLKRRAESLAHRDAKS